MGKHLDCWKKDTLARDRKLAVTSMWMVMELLHEALFSLLSHFSFHMNAY